MATSTKYYYLRRAVHALPPYSSTALRYPAKYTTKITLAPLNVAMPGLCCHVYLKLPRFSIPANVLNAPELRIRPPVPPYPTTAKCPSSMSHLAFHTFLQSVSKQPSAHHFPQPAGPRIMTTA
ncbi:hypothetical protein CCM_04870 [Cordyceps militaris CM01]|uniref:Uncharacterized protein n=1 Tax=Cordyceps militaris (strain CM01) TaxID=983644 RepID=G3JF03_CORMM|nr:uncharacterized protein CCM_04870 [Cordyceps militaris CM01]EGX93496.1 hypothetical protein CCM_04870 [Cordyceps militaris CM01]